MARRSPANSELAGVQNEYEADGSETVDDSVRPNLKGKEEFWIEQVQPVDKVMGEKCYVCRVGDGV